MRHVDLAVVIFAVDFLGDFLSLFAVAADDGEFVLALLAVPDGVFAAEVHGDANLACVGGDFNCGQRGDPHYNPRAAGQALIREVIVQVY